MLTFVNFKIHYKYFVSLQIFRFTKQIFEIFRKIFKNHDVIIHVTTRPHPSLNCIYLHQLSVQLPTNRFFWRFPISFLPDLISFSVDIAENFLFPIETLAKLLLLSDRDFGVNGTFCFIKAPFSTLLASGPCPPCILCEFLTKFTLSIGQFTVLRAGLWQKFRPFTD